MKYKEYSFKELLSNIVDNRGRTCPTAEEGIPLIATNCIRNEQLYPSYEKIRYISQDTYDTWFRDHPIPDDMIFVCKGSPGRVCWVPNPVNFCIAQDMVAIRADETKVYPKYLFALLRSSETQHHIENMHVGTLIPHFKKGDFGNLFLHIPEDYEYQRKVGDMYFQFCKKIELNRQINQTLETMAQAIFKSWFVDFEPVKAKIAAIEAGEDAKGVTRAAMSAISGKTYEELDQLQAEQPEHYIQLKNTAELFPSSMQNSELGEIPEKWEVKKVDEILELAYGKPLKEDTRLQGNIPVYGSNGQIGWHNQKLVDGPGIVVGRKGNPGTVTWVHTHFYPIDTTFYVIPKGPVKSLNYLLYALKKQDLPYLAADSAVPGLNRNIVYMNKIIVPQRYILDLFDVYLNNIDQKIQVNKEQSRVLESIRDILLPKLLSGELSVDAADLAEGN